jgi:histidine ammonia-lyase
MSGTLVIGESPTALSELVRAARQGDKIDVASSVRQRLVSSRAVVDRYLVGDEPIYGLNTGLGGNVKFRLAPDEIADFQTKMIRGRCIGVGEPFPEGTARAIFLSRILGLSRGGSGISPEVFQFMVDLYNAGLVPVIPGRGSIGGGDLGLCAHIGLAIIGEGEFFVAGARVPANMAIADAGLAIPTLGPKDGLSILNSSAVTCGHAAEVLTSLSRILGLSVLTAALADEGYAANAKIYDPRLAAARPANGQVRAAAMFRTVLSGSYLYDPQSARSIQDALSFRVLSQIYGPAIAAFENAVESVETELNSAADNPLVLEEEILSTANFHTPAIAVAFDTLAITVTQLATSSAYRTIKMMNHLLSGLPKYLSPIGGASNGFNSLQKTVSYLHGEIRLKATPASLDSLPVSESVEDHAPQTPLTIRKLEEQLVPYELLISIEALVAAQAVDLRERPNLAALTGTLFDNIRAAIPMLVEDRPTGPDVDKVKLMFSSTSFLKKMSAGLASSADWPKSLRLI